MRLLGDHRDLEAVCREWGRATKAARADARREDEAQADRGLAIQAEADEEQRQEARRNEVDEFAERWSIDNDGNWFEAGERDRIVARQSEQLALRRRRLGWYFL